VLGVVGEQVVGVRLLDLSFGFFANPYDPSDLQFFDEVVIEVLGERSAVGLDVEVIDPEPESLGYPEPELVELHLFVHLDVCFLLARVQVDLDLHVFSRVVPFELFFVDVLPVVPGDQGS
jgi:hypothetical protein